MKRETEAYIIWKERDDRFMNFCPNCGAKFKEGGKK